MVHTNIFDVLQEIQYWLELVVFRIVYFLYRCALVVYHWDKGGTVPPIKNPILLQSGKALAEQIRKGKLKSEEVVQAFIDRIVEVEPCINAIVQCRFDEALKEAIGVDELVRSGKFTEEQLEKEKPLLGIPFTIKSLLSVKGFPHTAGSLLFKDRIASEDAPPITLIKQAGGIVLATSNVPEFGIAFETINLLYGKTSNPYDLSKTPGGSSGGEAALLGAGASVIGIANDLNGSLRVPAHFTGVFSHKATTNLISNQGSFPSPHPKLDYLMHTGPMCRFSEDLVLLTKLLSAGKEHLADLDRKIHFENLKVYFITSIKDPKALPVDKEIVDGIQKAVNHFAETYNAAVKQIRIPLLDHSNKMTLHLLSSPISNLLNYLSQGKMTHASLLAEFVKSIFGKSILSMYSIFIISLSRWPFLFKPEAIPFYGWIRQQLAKEFDKLLDENSILLYPTFPTTAFYHYECPLVTTSSCYVNSLSYFGLPITNCPIGLNKNGMPMGIQVIGQKYNDALTLAVAEELSKVFGGWIPPGKTNCNTCL